MGREMDTASSAGLISKFTQEIIKTDTWRASVCTPGLMAKSFKALGRTKSFTDSAFRLTQTDVATKGSTSSTKSMDTVSMRIRTTAATQAVGMKAKCTAMASCTVRTNISMDCIARGRRS